jgi:hypothetical protein
MAWVSRSSMRLARSLFHLMLLNGPKLERRQVLLGRVVDIGVELFAASAACAYGRHLAEKERQPSALELADHYCKLARRKVALSFEGLWDNDDKDGYALSKRVVAGEYAWLEQGVMPVEDFK